MAEAVVSLLVERLGDWLIDKTKFLCGVSNHVEQLRVELTRMQCFLKDADKRQDEREMVRQLVSEIREVAFDAEDVIETYALEFESRRKGDANNLFQKLARTVSEGTQSLNVGPKIKELTSKISNLTTLLQTYGIIECGPNPLIERQRVDQRQTFAHVEDTDVVGFEKNIEELVGCLVAEEKQHRVVSICGMGGSGKTTLAKKVYHHGKVKRHFHCRAWVYISQQCQRRQVWEGILVSLLSPSGAERDQISKLKDEEVAEKLYLIQQEKKCLVILDDIWSTEAWDLISAGFPSSTDTGSKILVTSRNKEVALHVDPRRFHHEPQCLNDEQSWKLLQKKAISWREGSECKDMEELGKEMVRCCKGLPLAITVLGGLLATKQTLEEWKEVHGHVMLDLQEQKDQQFSQVLTLSYDDLPYHLKPCFLYLGHFPEDFEISTKKLIRMWMAEGFIPMQGTYGRVEKMEDTGEQYLRQLIQRSLVQVGKRDLMSERIKTCRVHDIMRELCLSKAKEENFLQFINYRPKENEATLIGKVRRFSICCNEVPIKLIPLIYKECPYIRSLLYFGLDYVQNEQLMSSMFKDFKLLRVLNFENSKSGRYWIPKEIEDLIHLRFLTISGELAELLSYLSNLRCLQTLDISSSTCHQVIKAEVIQNMEQLRHLYLPYMCRIRGKLQWAKFTHLQTLVNIPISASLCDLDDLAKLPDLTKLKIYLEGPLEKDAKSLMPTLEILRFLNVDIGPSTHGTDIRPIVSRCPHLYKLLVRGMLEKLPELNQISPNLTKLILESNYLKEDPMPTLEKLPKLKILRFDDYAFEGENMVCSAGGFPQLQSLHLIGLFDLEEWTVEEGAMPSLCNLRIDGSNKLRMVPEGLRFVTTLQELKIRAPKEFTDRVDKGGQDFYKIQHVPSVVIQTIEVVDDEN